MPPVLFTDKKHTKKVGIRQEPTETVVTGQTTLTHNLCRYCNTPRKHICGIPDQFNWLLSISDRFSQEL